MTDSQITSAVSLLDGPDAGAPPVGTLSPPVSRFVVARVLRGYRAGRLLDAQPVAEGLLNRGYRVTTSTGRYFLKCYVDRATATLDAITAQHRATTALHARGLPLAPPLAGRDGRTVTDCDGRRFAIFPWVPGNHLTGAQLRLPQCEELGALLGQLHGALAQVCAPVTPSPAPPTADPRATTALIGELRELARRHRPYGPFDLLAERRLTERAALLETYGHRRPAPGAAGPAGWTHGDFHGLNLIYRGGRVAAVLDWDRLRVQPRGEEAVRAATLIFNDPVSGELDLARVRHYARGYREAAAAPPEELAAAAHRVWWERLNDFWMLKWRYQRADQRADPLFPAAAAQTVWWCQEYEQVLDAFVN